MPKNYMILRHHDWDSLAELVQDRILQGWFPQGGVAVSRTDSYASEVYYQALTKDVFSFKTKDSGAISAQQSATRLEPENKQ